MKIKEKIGDKYYFERNGRFFGAFTKNQIYERAKNMHLENNPMTERKKLIDEYEKIENEKRNMEQDKLDEDFKKNGGMRNVFIGDDFCNNTGESMDNVFLAKWGSNNRFTKLENFTALGKFNNNYLGVIEEKFYKIKKEHPFFFWLTIISSIVGIIGFILDLIGIITPIIISQTIIIKIFKIIF